GLTIAIPVLLLFQWLSTRADKVIDHIDEVGTEFIVTHALADSGSSETPVNDNQTNITEATV
ncbi:MAG: hypothetical protein VXY33_09370, partial [Verrucomicrobiota bacterium]|nr:hypothetical protein [Verrucomicrobiota bacterium]